MTHPALQAVTTYLDHKRLMLEHVSSSIEEHEHRLAAEVEHKGRLETEIQQLEDFLAGNVLAETEIGKEVSESDAVGGENAGTRNGS